MHGEWLIPKFGLLAAVGSVATWLANDALVSALMALAAIIILPTYRIFKKHKRTKIDGVLDFVDRNIVELILGLILVPNAIHVVTQLLGG